MSYFWVGQKVVCVDDTPPVCGFEFDTPRKGAIYTVAKVWLDPDGAGLALHEITRCERALKWWNGEAGFHAWRFRPVEYKAMQIFRAIAANPKIKLRENA